MCVLYTCIKHGVIVIVILKITGFKVIVIDSTLTLAVIIIVEIILIF